MSNRSFVLALVGMLVAAAVFVLWTLSGSQTQEGDNSAPSLDATTSKKRPSRRQQSTMGREKKGNRFSSLTDQSIRWQVRVDQLRRLDASTLNTKEIDFLYSLLHEHPVGHRDEAWWVVVNEVMEQIVKQDIAAERIAPAFIQLMQDKTLHPVVRDYAVQHISNYYQQGKEDGGGAVLEGLVDVISDPTNQHNTIPGTALMGLVEISSNPELTEQVQSTVDNLENYLTSLISGDLSASVSNQTSAINVVGLLQQEQYLPLVLKQAMGGSTNDSIQLSSIASLGDFFRNEKIDDELALKNVEEILRSYTEGGTKFKYAAAAALKKLPKTN